MRKKGRKGIGEWCVKVNFKDINEIMNRDHIGKGRN